MEGGLTESHSQNYIVVGVGSCPGLELQKLQSEKCGCTKSKRVTDRADAEVGSVRTPGQGGIQRVNWVLHTADDKSKVYFGITGDHPTLTSAAPNVTKRCTGDPPIDGVGNLPRHLRQTEASIQNGVQTGPSIDNRSYIDHFAVRTDDAILVYEDLPMLVILIPDRNLSDGELWKRCDVFKAGDKFTDGDITGIEIRGVIGPA